MLSCETIKVGAFLKMIMTYLISDNTEYCYVLAFAEKSGDGYDIRSVGMRPWELDEHDFKDYNNLVGIFFHLDLVKKFF